MLQTYHLFLAWIETCQVKIHLTGWLLKTSQNLAQLGKTLPVALLMLLLALLFRTVQSQGQAGEIAQKQPIRPTQSSFVIELSALPVAVVYAQSLSEGVVAADVATLTQAQLATVEDQQQALLAQLSGLEATVLYRTQRVFNGVAVRIAPDQVEQIKAWAGVIAVYPLLRKVPHHANSLPVIGAPDLWEGVNNNKLTGEGVSIAVIDTGVDYIHSDLGGTGNSALYNLNNQTVITDNMSFPNAKVVGGFDFVGETYNADPDSNTFQPNPEPDPDPMDCYGHGTHVAGTVAGGGVNSDGSAYTGIYDTNLNLTALKVAPGVAPKAQLYALKVFGCAGSSEVTDLAIEWAVDPNGDGDLSDKVDVINMSLGSTYGATLDVSTIASNNAAAAGVIVVASAGNSGDVHFITGSPAVADRVISVAASGYDNGSGIDYVASFSSRGPSRGNSALKPDIAAPGLTIFSASSGSGSGGRFSSGTSMAAPHVAGSMALLRQLYPDWTVQELKALVMNTAQPLIRAGFTITSPIYSPARIGNGRIDLRMAVESQLLAFDAAAPERVSISFGATQVVTTTVYTRSLAVVNQETTPISLTLTYIAQSDLPGAEIFLPQTAISLAAHSMVTVPVVLTVEPAALQRSYDETLRNIGLRYWLSEEMGTLELTPDSAQPTIHVALYANPKPISSLALTQASFDFGTASLPTFTLTLSGTGLSTLDPITPSTPRTGYNSLLSLTELQWSSPNTPPVAPDYPALVAGPYDNADIRYFGIANNLAATGLISKSLLYFAVASYADWSSPNEVEFSIYVDSDNDGADDYRIFNSDFLHILNENLSSDAFAVGLEVLESGDKLVVADLNEMAADEGDAALFGNNVLILPISPAAIGLTQTDSAFSYHVESAVAEMTGIVDRSPQLYYDLRQQAIQASNGIGSPIQIVDADFASSYQFDAVRAGGQSDALVFFHHNGTGKRVGLVRLTSNVAQLYLPIVGK